MSKEANRTGATLVTYDSPTGDRHSSPSVWNVYAANSQIGLTSTPVSARLPPRTMNTNPTPSRKSPATILSAVEGSRRRRPRALHMAAKMGANTRIAKGFTDWYQLEGTMKL